jgi:uncharacterized membrane protein YphA (DoxX/SURF4 family)
MQKIIRNINAFLDRHNFAPLLLRMGLATVFIYAAVSSYLDPREWVGYLPSFIVENFNAEALLKLFSVYELLLAAWLLSGVYARYAGLLCALTLAGITVSNVSLFAISFRDIGLMFAALALMFTKEQS